MECKELVAITPSLLVSDNEYYVFRVRALIKRYSGSQKTHWSPPSAPIQPLVKRVENVSEKKAEAKAKAKKETKRKPPAPPVRSYEDATESVIEADLRGVLNGYHPTAQAAVEATLAKVKAQRSQDETNLQTLEDRNSIIAKSAREEQLNELVRMKRNMLNRAMEHGEAIAPNCVAAAAEAAEPAAKVTEGWD